MGYSRHIFVSPINSDLICLACEDVFRNPYTNQCGHTLCHNCWLNRVEHRTDDDDVEIIVCMHCREQSILSENKLKFNDDLHAGIMSLFARCGNQDCPRQMPLVNRELHMEVCKHNKQHAQLCCSKHSRRAKRIMRRRGHILKTVFRRTLMSMCRTVVDRAFETYTNHLNKIIDPLAENLEAIEEFLSGESDGSQKRTA